MGALSDIGSGLLTFAICAIIIVLLMVIAFLAEFAPDLPVRFWRSEPPSGSPQSFKRRRGRREGQQ